MTKLVKRTALPLAILAAALCTATVARADHYPPRACQLQLSQSVAKRGQAITASFCGLRPGSAVGFALVRTGHDGRWLGSASVGAHGKGKARLRIPSVDRGQWVVRANGRGLNGAAIRLVARLRVR